MADTDKAKKIEHFPAATDINVLLIAPHGVMHDDDNSGTLAREIATRLGCAAIINERYSRTKDVKGREFNPAADIVDLNSIKEVKLAGLEADFMERIKAVKDAILAKNNPNPCYIFLIHGIDDDNIHNPKNGVSTVPNKDSHILIGIGDHEDLKKVRYSADKKIAGKLAEYFRLPDKEGKFIKSEITTHEDYAGWSVDNLNQLFNNPKAKRYYDRGHVQSIQLEIQKDGFRDNKASIGHAATLLATAIQGLINEFNVVPAQEENGTLVPVPLQSVAPIGNKAEVPLNVEDKPEEALIERCYFVLVSQFHRRYQDAVLEAGRFLIREFFHNNIDFARLGEAGACKKLSLKGLIKKLSEEPDAPQKSWIYNTIKMVVEDHDVKEYAKEIQDKGLVRKYENIRLSHKVLLFPIADFAKKAEYIEIITKRNLTYQQLRELLGHNKVEEPPTLVKAIGSPHKLFEGDWRSLMEPEAIAMLELPDLQKSHKKAENEKDKLLALVSKYDDLIKQLSAAEKAKKKEKKKAAHGTEEWANENINFSTGCTHGCLYCYARRMAGRRKGYNVENWTTPKIRQHDVDKIRPKYEGRVMFPSSHDLIMGQWDQISIVLGKLLSVGNEVLIVSKPHIEVIEKICNEFSQYKAQMFFRFTIGSMDDNILAKWEPAAPHYEERKQSLKYAFDAGFSTSVSCEPMLDADNIDALIEDLRPYISDTFWIGKMDFHCVRKGSIDMEEKKRIQKGQANGNIMAIYDRLKDDPMVRWKDSIKEVVGIERPTESGQDI